MKLPVRLLIVGLAAAVFLSIVGLTKVEAQTILTDEQLQRISTNCQSIKNSLNQLHASDALLRVNRGQIYESMVTKLMNNFNARLANNSLDNKGLLVVTGGYQSALTTFRTDYQAYERQLSAAIRIDCEKQPSEFHFAVEDARDKRKKVHTDVLRLHQYIDDYRASVSDFLINYERITESD